MTSNTTSASDISVLKGKKMLQYPVGLGSSMKDSRGNDIQYTMIRIISDEKGSTLRNDRSTGTATEVRDISTGIGTVTLPTIVTTDASEDPDLVSLYGSSAGTTKMSPKKGKVKLDKVIILPMPNNYDVATSVQYNVVNPGWLTKAGDIANQFGNGIVGELATLAKNAGVSGIVNKIKAGGTDMNRLLAEEGLAMNPKKEVMFDSFGYRQFSFRYTFAPKNKEEAAVVNEIIETLRYYSLPEISSAKFFYILPAEFQIEFMIGAKINSNIPRIANSFLQSIVVNMSPGGVWASLPDGSPVAIEISMNFMENELIDRNRVYSTNSDGTLAISAGY